MAEGKGRIVLVLKIAPELLWKTREWITKYDGKELHLARTETDHVVDWCRQICDAFDSKENLIIIPPPAKHAE